MGTELRQLVLGGTLLDTPPRSMCSVKRMCRVWSLTQTRSLQYVTIRYNTLQAVRSKLGETQKAMIEAETMCKEVRRDAPPQRCALKHDL